MNHEDLYFAGDNGIILLKKKFFMVRDGLSGSTWCQRLRKMNNVSNIYCDGMNSYAKWVNKDYEDYILSYYGNLQIMIL